MSQKTALYLSIAPMVHQRLWGRLGWPKRFLHLLVVGSRLCVLYLSTFLSCTWIPDPGSRILDPGSGILDPGSRTLDLVGSAQEPARYQHLRRVAGPGVSLRSPGGGAGAACLYERYCKLQTGCCKLTLSRIERLQDCKLEGLQGCKSARLRGPVAGAKP